VDKIELGSTGMMISPMGVGAWSWGDRLFWNYGRGYAQEDVRQVFQTAVAAGINFFDTAEVYGFGGSEKMLGRLIKSSGAEINTTTKFFPYPWRFWPGAVTRALRSSLGRLQLDAVDQYMVHWPYAIMSIETLMKAFARAVQEELARSVGVSNFNLDRMKRAQIALSDFGLSLASNQVAFSLIEQDPLHNGLLDACQDMGITLVAYSPLAQGILTGKFTSQNPPPGARRRWSRQVDLEQLPALIGLMTEIGQKYGDKSPAQVAINWTMMRGAVPIPGAKNREQMQDNLGALGWRMAEDEAQALEKAAVEVTR
jgi:aryl-alcohol dehydrogenase-like predicted oxidoreductase